MRSESESGSRLSWAHFDKPEARVKDKERAFARASGLSKTRNSKIHRGTFPLRPLLAF